MQSRVTFNRVPKKVPEKVWEALVQSERGHVQQGSQEGSGAGAEPGQVQHGSGEGSGEGLGGFGAEALAQSQVTFNRVTEKVAEKVPGSFGAKPSQVQRVEKVLEKALGIFGAGLGQVQQVQQGFQRLASQHA